MSLTFLLGQAGQPGHVLLVAVAEAQECNKRHAGPGLRTAASSLPPHSVDHMKSCGLVQIQGHAPAMSYDNGHGYGQNGRTGSSSVTLAQVMWSDLCVRSRQQPGGWIRGVKVGLESQPWAKWMPQDPTIRSFLYSKNWDFARSGKGWGVLIFILLFDPKSSAWAL